MSRCREPGCRAEVVWATVARSGKRVPFDVNPVPPRTRAARPIADVDGERVCYGPDTLARVLMATGHAGYDTAMRAVYDDFPWHVPHPLRCPPTRTP